MSFRYRLHARGLAVLLVVALLSALFAAVRLDGGWRVVAAFPLLAAVIAASLWASGLTRARELGAVELDARGLRRVRGSGRVAATVRWPEVRRIVVDRRRRMLLVEGRQVQTVFCNGPTSLGGVGVERFEDLLRALPQHTAVPFTEVGRRAARPIGDDEVTAERTTSGVPVPRGTVIA